MKKKYILRLFGRAAALIVALLLYFIRPDAFSVLDTENFFREPGLLHLLWLIWIGDMILQLIPARSFMALGSEKQFARYFKPVSPPA